MKLNLTGIVFFGCAAFVLGNGQAPPDDDDFAFDGSGFAEPWPSSTAAPKTDDPSTSTASPWYDSSALAGSGSGQHSDDEDYNYLETPEDEDDYDVYDYEDYDYEEEEDEKPDDTSEEKTESKTVGVVHSIPPVKETEVHSERKPTLGAERRPEIQPTSTEKVITHDQDDAVEATQVAVKVEEEDEPDLVIPPEVTLQMEDVEKELHELEEKQRELQREVERELELERELETTRPGDMDGLGTKAVDRNTSFFAQPGILAAVVGGAVVGLLCAILLVMLIVYRMRKKDEGSYPVDEPKRSLTGNSHNKNKEYYA